MNSDSVRVAIIGAGPSGLSQLVAFANTNAEVVCYEKQNEVGGQWNYSWRNGLDQYGEQVHSSMYRHLFINEPKEVLEYPEFSFEECFMDNPISDHQTSFVRREVIHHYLMQRIGRSGMRKCIRFETVVRNVTLDETSQKFTVTSKNLLTEKSTSEEFDYVVVATGHFSTPDFPYFQGLEKICKARVMHAHDFRNPEELKDKNVFVLGSSFSAEDIASMAWKFGAKHIYVSSRNPMFPYKGWPNNITPVKCLKEVEIVDDKECLVLTDGTKLEKIDWMIFCTGYIHHFPFIEEKLLLRTKNVLYPTQLYKGVFFKNHPKMMYLGMQNQWLSFAMLDTQAWLARDFCMGKFAVPSLKDMEEDIATWVKGEEELESIVAGLPYQIKYRDELAKLTDYETRNGPDGKPIRVMFPQKIEAILNKWVEYKLANIMTFRDQQYQSVYTDKLAPPAPVKWAELVGREKDQM